MVTFQLSAALAIPEQDCLLFKPIPPSLLGCYISSLFSQPGRLCFHLLSESLHPEGSDLLAEGDLAGSAFLSPPNPGCDCIQSSVTCSLIWLLIHKCLPSFPPPCWAYKLLGIFCVTIYTTLPKNSPLPVIIFAEWMRYSFAISHWRPVYFSPCFIRSLDNHRWRTCCSAKCVDTSEQS